MRLDLGLEPVLDKTLAHEWLFDRFPKGVDVKLFDDVGQIYELVLAEMELEEWEDELEQFRKRAAYYEEVEGRKTHHFHISAIKGKGQIGRTSQYLTHWYYPYKAKFHPQMVKALINWTGLREGDLLLDPFVGSGTALIEARTIGVNTVGIDIDPVCILQAKVKCELLDMTADEIEVVPRNEVFDFFDKHLRDKKSPLSPRLHEFFLLSYLYALSDYTYVQRDLWEAFNSNINWIVNTLKKWQKLQASLAIELGNFEVEMGDARKLDIPSESVDAIVTSPPYSIAVDYIKNDLHALKYLGLSPDKLREDLIGLRGRRESRIANYFHDMELAFEEMFRVLKKGSRCAVIIGDVTYNGNKLPIKEWFIQHAQHAGFTCKGIIRRPILGGYARLRYEYILLFEK
jgi:hypothetical protein